MSRGNRISMMEAIKRRDPELAGIKRKITQRESQKIDFILKVLDYGLNHNEFSVRSMQKNLNISRNSIDNTIHLLLEKKLIKLNSIRIKNEKFYKITSKKNVRKYYDDLQKWKFFKISINALPKSALYSIDGWQRFQNKMKRIAQKNTKRNVFSSRDISTLKSIPLQFRIKSNQEKPTKSWSKPAHLNSLPASTASTIIEKYQNLRYCDICLKEGKLVDVINISEYEVVCTEKAHYFDLVKK